MSESDGYTAEQISFIVNALTVATCGRGDKRSNVFKLVQNLVVFSACMSVKQSGKTYNKAQRAAVANKAMAHQGAVVWRNMQPVIAEMGANWPAHITEASLQNTTMTGT